MKATVRWLDDVMFLAESGSGHTVTIDGPESEGGRNIGVRPMEMMLMGLGGCASFDVMKILENLVSPLKIVLRILKPSVQMKYLACSRIFISISL